MVVDTLDNLEKYVSLNPLFADVVKFIKDNDLSKLEDGKHFIKEGNLFVNITTSQVSLLSSGHKMVISHASVVVISTRLSSRLRIKEEIFKIKLKKNNIE